MPPVVTITSGREGAWRRSAATHPRLSPTVDLWNRFSPIPTK